MGDAVLASSVIPFLARQHPGADIHFATASPWHEMFVRDPRLAGVHVLQPDRRSLLPEPGGQWDVVVDLQNNRRSAGLRLRYAPGARAATFDKLHGKRALLLALRLNTYTSSETVVARCLRAAGWDGSGALPALPSIVVDEQALGEAADMLGEPRARMLGMAPFCAWRNKAWPQERYAEVGKWFAQNGWRVAVLGGPADRTAGEALASRIGEGALSLAGVLSLAASAAVLQRSTAAIGNDTGLMHLARAVGTPTVTIYGATTWHWGFFPWGEPPYRVLETPLWCRPCHAHGGNVCWRVFRPCLTRVTCEAARTAVEEVAGAAGQNLRGSGA